MKKVLSTAVAASIVAAAGAAGAATIYTKDNFSYTVKGDWQIELRQKIGEDQDLDVDFDDLEIKNRVEYEINDGLTAFGQLDFGFKGAANDPGAESGHLEEAYLGLAMGDVEFLFGKTASAADEFGVSVDIKGTIDTNAFPVSDGDDLIKVSAAFGPVNFIAAYEIESSRELDFFGIISIDYDESFYDFYADFSYAGLTIAGAYQNYEVKFHGMSADWNTFGVSASYDCGFAVFGAAYSSMEDVLDVWSIGLEVPFNAVTFGVGYDINEPDMGDDVTGWYVNATYAFPSAPNVTLFAEVGDDDSENTDMGYLAGMRIKF